MLFWSIAQLLTNRVHFAAFARVRPFRPAMNLVGIAPRVTKNAFRSACENQHTRFESPYRVSRANAHTLTVFRESEIIPAT
jgi:hypothetical protein